MSSKNNVNPDHYKVAGRERPGEDIVHDVEKQQLAQAEARMRKRSRGAKATEGSAPQPATGHTKGDDPGGAAKS